MWKKLIAGLKTCKRNGLTVKDADWLYELCCYRNVVESAIKRIEQKQDVSLVSFRCINALSVDHKKEFVDYLNKLTDKLKNELKNY